MLKSKKGLYGYFSQEKKRRLIMTIGLFALPILILLSGILYHGSKNNILTVVAMVGMIPAAMSLVNLIMVVSRHSLPEEEYRTLEAHEGDLTVAYELYMTSDKKNSMIDCLVICGREVVGLITDKKTDPKFAQEHLKKMLRANGYKTNVCMLTDLKRFTERMDSLNDHADSLREGIAYEPDPRYPNYDWEYLIRHVCLLISL